MKTIDKRRVLKNSIFENEEFLKMIQYIKIAASGNKPWNPLHIDAAMIIKPAITMFKYGLLFLIIALLINSTAAMSKTPMVGSSRLFE